MKGRTKYENRSAVHERDDGSIDYGDAPVLLGGTSVPRKVAYVIEGSDGEPSAEASFEVQDSGAIVCTAVSFSRSPGGRSIVAGDLNTFPTLSHLGEQAFLALAYRVADDPHDWFISDPDMKRAARDDIGSSSHLSELREMARVYKENFNGNPTAAVVAQFGYSRRTIARRLDEARDLGLLPRTSKGKKKVNWDE